MSHSDDLTGFLNEWPYRPGEVNARKIKGADGRPKLQIRLDLGVLQMELTGRPDGSRPHDCESMLEYELARLDAYRQENGSENGFVLSSEECRRLREEAVQYYHRYVGRFAIGDHDGVIEDTTRNLAVLDLCRAFGETETDRAVLEQFRPHIITMRTRSRAEQAIAADQPKHALSAIDSGLAELRVVFDEAGAGDRFENANEVQLLRGMRDALVPKLPMSERIEKRERLRAALDAENYELAAILRDELRMLGD